MSVMGNEFSGLPIAELIGGPLKAACDAQVRLAKATADFINTVGFNPVLDANNNPTGKLEPRQVDFSFWKPLPIAPAVVITEIKVTNGGSGYDPSVAANTKATVVGGGCTTTASASVTVDANGKVTGVTIMASGAGYTSAPTIEIKDTRTSGTLGTGATAVAFVSPDTTQNSAAQVQKVVLSIPFLAIVNIPALMVKTVDISFDMEVKSSESHKDESSMEAALDASARAGWGPFSAEVKIHGAVASKQENTRSTDRSAKYHVQVQARDDGMPEGLSRVLDILQKAIAPVSTGPAVTLASAKIAQKVLT